MGPLVWVSDEVLDGSGREGLADLGEGPGPTIYLKNMLPVASGPPTQPSSPKIPLPPSITIPKTKPLRCDLQGKLLQTIASSQALIFFHL